MNSISGPVIQTFSGIYFNLLNPCPEDVRIDDIAHALANLCRFGGHTRRFYSVAQHSLLVAELVPPGLAFQALLHDAAEAYCGDMVSPLKMCVPGYVTIQKRIEAAIAERFNIPAELPDEIKRADLVALATERRDLMPWCERPWQCLDGIEPRRYPIYAMQPDNAHEEFQAQFDYHYRP